MDVDVGVVIFVVNGVVDDVSVEIVAVFVGEGVGGATVATY